MSTLHPFGELLYEFRARKSGLSQNRLAELAGYSPSVLVRMCQGKKDLTGPSGRERIVRIVETLCDEGVHLTVAEVNALLAAANLPPLYDGLLSEANLIHRLHGHVSIGTSVSVQRTNLLPSLTSFIGRETDVASLVLRLSAVRLVTLVGAGGVGKTRLALEVAAHLMNTFRDGVWLVELAAVSEPKYVTQRVAQTLGIPTTFEGSESHLALRALQHQMQSKHILIVLDNCEHVVDACTELVENLLPRCPNLRILATSREALRTPGEVIWQVASLSSPSVAQLNPARLLEFEAVQLFVERASARKQHFELNASSASAVYRICKHLDGVPLALELVAALVEAMSPQEIVTLLDKRLALTAEGHRRAVPRHHTMRDSLDWSYSLLTLAQQRLLAYLSVFVSGWTVDAAKAVGSTNPSDLSDVISQLLQLVQKSMVLAEPRDRGTRYRMLEPVRQYAAQKLELMGEAQLARDRHLMYFIDFTEAIRTLKVVPDDWSTWTKLILADLDNLLTAHIWSRTKSHDCELELRLVLGLWRFWLIHAELRDGYSRISSAFARCSNPSASVKAHALCALATLCRYLRNYRQMSLFAEEGLSLCRQLEDQVGTASCLALLAVRADIAFDYAQAESLRAEAIGIFESIGNVAEHNDIFLDMSWTLEDRGDYGNAVVQLRKFGNVSRDLHDLQGIWIEQWELAFVAHRCSDTLQAKAYLQIALESARIYGMGEFIARTLERWALLDAATALTLVEQELYRHRDIGDSRGVADLLLAAGRINLDQGNFAHAHSLLRECVMVWDTIGPLGSEWGGPAWACMELGHIAYLQHQFPLATAEYEEGLRRHKDASSMDGIPCAYLHLGHTLLRQRDVQGAIQKFLESLHSFHEAGIRWGIALSLGGMAKAKRSQGQSTQAARLVGAARALLRDDELFTMRPIELTHAEFIVRDSVEQNIGENVHAWTEGLAMSIQEAIALGLAEGKKL